MLNSPAFLENPLAMAVSYPFLRAMILHTSVLFKSTSNELLGLFNHAVLDVCAFLHCDIRASLHDCWAQLLLCICDAGFQGTANCVLETSLLSLLKQAPFSHTVICTLGSIEHTLFGSTWIISFLDVDWFHSCSRLFVGSSAAGSSATITSMFSSSALSAIWSSAVSTGDSAAGFSALAWLAHLSWRVLIRGRRRHIVA